MVYNPDIENMIQDARAGDGKALLPVYHVPPAMSTQILLMGASNANANHSHLDSRSPSVY